MFPVFAVSASPTFAVPEIVGSPVGARFAVPAATTALVARLVTVSCAPAPSVNVTLTLMRCPSCAGASAYTMLVAFAIAVSLPSH